MISNATARFERVVNGLATDLSLLYRELLKSPDAQTLAQLWVLDNQLQRFGKVERGQLQVHITPLAGGDVSVFSLACVCGDKEIFRIASLEIRNRRTDISE